MKTLGEVLPWVLRGAGCIRAMWSGDTGSLWRGRPGTELPPPREDQLRRGRTNSAGRLGPGPAPGQFSLCRISLCNGSNGFKPPNVSLLFSFLLPLCDDIYPYRGGKAAWARLCLGTIPDPHAGFAYWPVEPPVGLILFHRSHSQLSLQLQTAPAPSLPLH